MRIFLIAAIVLIVFGIIALAGTSTLFGVTWAIWFMASFLAYLVDCLVGGWIVTAWANRPIVAQPTQPQ